MSNGHMNYRTTQTLAIMCGLACLVEIVQSELARFGFCIDPGASTKLVLDFPCGHGLSIAEGLRKKPRTQLIVVT
jgi:hypothetical protein